MAPVSTPPVFDSYADSYERALAEGPSVSGEDRRYFANGRVNWLANCLRESDYVSGHLMDYGCGTGSTIEPLLNTLTAETLSV